MSHYKLHMCLVSLQSQVHDYTRAMSHYNRMCKITHAPRLSTTASTRLHTRHVSLPPQVHDITRYHTRHVSIQLHVHDITLATSLYNCVYTITHVLEIHISYSLDSWTNCMQVRRYSIL